jgi:hypothetical protein
VRRSGIGRIVRRSLQAAVFELQRLFIDRDTLSVVSNVLHEVPSVPLEQTRGGARRAIDDLIPEISGNVFDTGEQPRSDTTSPKRWVNKAGTRPGTEIGSTRDRIGLEHCHAAELLVAERDNTHWQCISICIGAKIRRSIADSAGSIVRSPFPLEPDSEQRQALRVLRQMFNVNVVAHQLKRANDGS